MTIVEGTRSITGGVDTHLEVNVVERSGATELRPPPPFCADFALVLPTSFGIPSSPADRGCSQRCAVWRRPARTSASQMMSSFGRFG
jgi:hypothetical protein